jgi:hypothetical protein
VTAGAAFGGPTPRRLVLGGFRQRVEVWRTIAAAFPAVVVVVAVVVVSAWLYLRGGWRGPVGVACLLPAPLVAFRRRIVAYLAGLYWRARWSWDCRSAGLVLVAERGIDRAHNLAVSSVEVAPTLVAVRCRRGGRTYIVRPLPGQTVEDYTAACGSLRLRWRAHSVTVDRLPGRVGRGRIEVRVATGAVLDRPVVFRGGAR